MHRIFMGPHGLRAGWRLTLYLLLAATMILLAGFLFQRSGNEERGVSTLWWGLLFEAELLTAAAVPAVIMSRIERRPAGDYGLPRRGAFTKPFWAGAAWGIVSLTGLLLAMRLAGLFTFGSLALHGARIWKFAAYWGVFFLVVSFFEEFLFRGYTQFTLSMGIGFWPAAVLLSAGFGCIHFGNEGEAWTGVIAAAFLGLFFCLTLRRTGTLWFAVGFHAAWDWAESYLYSAPDSGLPTPGHLLRSSFHGPSWLTGGSVGPEGSVLIFALIAVLWLAFSRLYPEVRWGAAPATPAPAVSHQE